MTDVCLFGRVAVIVVCLMSGPAIEAAQPTVISTREKLFGGSVSYLGQGAENGVLVLNANNGFFDKGAFRADGKQPAPDDDKQLISSHFTHLVPVGTSDGSARWYVWTPEAGSIDVAVYFDVPRSDVGQSWVVAVDGNAKPIRLSSGSQDQPQKVTLSFRVQGETKHTIELRRADASRPSRVNVYGLVLRGDAIEKASLLRARWRPAAVHTGYHSSSCPMTKMWVFESQNLSNVSSYSPMTTRFGYFGGTFAADGTAAGGINFSMWAAGQNAKEAPPLDQMPHLLATGNPEAEFSGFGHEGSGVKIRNWEPYAHHPKSIIQALRVETADGYDTYTGYLYDERVERWVLYAQGRKPTASKRTDEETALRPNSFCEVPGPPNVERTGDQRRAMRRRGWFFGADENWHAVDRQTVAIKRGEAPVNKFIGVDDEGWFVMGTGGLEMLEGRTEVRGPARTSKLPAYLQPEKVQQLHELPVGIGTPTVDRLTATSASVHYELERVGSDAKATVYYGSVDCLTFAPRAMHGTEKKGLSSEMLSADRTWAHATSEQAVQNGPNAFVLEGLEAGQKYYFRLLVTDDDGKCWADATSSYETR